ncbi:porin [Limnohabitans sp. Rim11]|uniref:porin n=1 Tax=Limnohabitans sp. Rim11 TaxID=1100719 RepID=UPI000AA941A4|nr:porin [Limnohabitans sp. Rim11]
MKKTLIALAALAATSAFAQSSVSISGSIQYGVSRSAAGVNSFGALKGDRNFVNFGGVEDLGGGTNVTFTAQQRFRSESGRLGTYYATDSIPSTGTTAANTNTADQRNAFEQTAIGVNTKNLGALRLGRFTNILGFNSYNLMEDSGNGAGTSSQNGRLSAQVQYTSPAINGFQYIYLNAAKASNKYGTVAGNGYGSGTLIGTTQDLTAHTIKYTNGPVFAQYSVVDGLIGEASTHLGGTYDLGGGLKLAAGQFNQKDAFGTQLAHKNTSFGAEYKFGAWTTAIMRSTANAKIAAADVGKKEQTGLKAYYNLSKRTSIDTEYSKTSKSAAASNGNAYYVGLRHTF